VGLEVYLIAAQFRCRVNIVVYLHGREALQQYPTSTMGIHVVLGRFLQLSIVLRHDGRLSKDFMSVTEYTRR
jgi:hypothetical protein